MHWAFAIPFLVCYITALILFVVYNPHPLRPGREIFSWIHKISGLCMLILPILVLVSHPREIKVHLNNIKEGWLWTLGDIKWMMLMPFSVISKKVQLPEEGKFNAGEKMNFMLTMATHPLYGVTGLMIWFASDTALPWLAHFAMAAVATPLMLVHIFMATINPGTRAAFKGMITGYVDRTWASHHYRRWFRENYGDGPLPLTAEQRDNRSAVDDWLLGSTGEFAQMEEKTVFDTNVGAKIREAIALAKAGDPPPATEAPTSILKPGDAPPRLPRRRTRTQTAIHVGIRAGVALTPSTIALVVLMGAGLLGAGMFVGLPVRPADLFVLAEHPLLSRPSASASPVAGGPVERGARITRLDEVGAFALVQDAHGRAGYLLRTAISVKRPRIIPESHAFPDCHRAFDEKDNKGCRNRATEMLNLCRTGCPPGEQAICESRCEERHRDCVVGCENDLQTAPHVEDSKRRRAGPHPNKRHKKGGRRGGKRKRR